MDTLLNKLKEPTTWVGILTMAGTAWGALSLTPELQSALASALAGIAGAVLVYIKQRKNG